MWGTIESEAETRFASAISPTFQSGVSLPGIIFGRLYSLWNDFRIDCLK